MSLKSRNMWVNFINKLTDSNNTIYAYFLGPEEDQSSEDWKNECIRRTDDDALKSAINRMYQNGCSPSEEEGFKEVVHVRR